MKKKLKKNKQRIPMELVNLIKRHAVKESKKAYSRKGNKPKLFQDAYKHSGRNFYFRAFSDIIISIYALFFLIFAIFI